jgi:hypothetical protein
VLVLVPDALEDDEARQLREIQVEDNEIGLFACNGLDRGLSVVGA